MKLTRLSCAVAILIASYVGAHAAAGKTSDPCTNAFYSSIPEHKKAGWSAHVDRNLAIYMIMHVQRVCQHIVDLTERDPALSQKGARSANLRLTATVLKAGVIEPLYHRFPDLRGRDLQDQKTPPLASLGPPKTVPQLGPVAARRISRAVDDATVAFFKSAPTAEESRDHFDKTWLDIVADIGFVSTPIDSTYPTLGLDRAKKIRLRQENVEHRTVELDARMRKAAIAPGSVRLSPAAVSLAKALLQSIKVQREADDWVASFSWVMGQASKGPDDLTWKEAGAGLVFGAFSRSQLPPDVIETISGVPIYFQDDGSHIAGKTIDVVKGQFVLRDR